MTRTVGAASHATPRGRCLRLQPGHVLGAGLQRLRHVVDHRGKRRIVELPVQLLHSRGQRGIERSDPFHAAFHDLDEYTPPIGFIPAATDKTAALEPIDHCRRRPRGQSGMRRKPAGRARTSQQQHVEALEIRGIESGEPRNEIADQHGLRADLAEHRVDLSEELGAGTLDHDITVFLNIFMIKSLDN
jgi:hypothetical protein